MGRYVLRRLLQLIPVFVGTTFLIYFLVWAVPGDPFTGMCGERPCPPQFVAAMTDKYNLDDNVVVQYLKYMGTLLTGDFGQTYAEQPIGDMIANAAPVSVRLAVIAVIIEAVIGVTAGILTGLRGRGFLDNLVLVSTLFLIAIPTFVTGFVIQIVLGFQLEILTPTVSTEAKWSELIIPGFVLGSLSMAYVSRLTRASISENRRADFMRTALAKGQPKSRIVGVHLLRNSAIPVITFLGTDIGNLMGGAIVTEGIFGIHGIGKLIFDGINDKQGAIVTGVVVLLVLVFLLVNLIIDLMYAVLDPRIRYD
ncbi:ABC transporter permease [Actinophytocola algeriensis]|uniref:Oligopeptide transport system permease protein n=1 Tax=Actinophytocola algeriensis TaxID=1768010 RepID=A0A7W7VI82_9PSEU|nr:ABC transporter permease [Actinophytocola algeriensis]MBB4911236.1 oligopeptide transport system permease protein [Actinophytocola algeriensis]MBE1479175.1 oligopeptide transport system permease protein [Actinophytocola algeriensis]